MLIFNYCKKVRENQKKRGFGQELITTQHAVCAKQGHIGQESVSSLSCNFLSKCGPVCREWQPFNCPNILQNRANSANQNVLSGLSFWFTKMQSFGNKECKCLGLAKVKYDLIQGFDTSYASGQFARALPAIVWIENQLAVDALS